MPVTSSWHDATARHRSRRSKLAEREDAVVAYATALDNGQIDLAARIAEKYNLAEYGLDYHLDWLEGGRERRDNSLKRAETRWGM